MIFLDIETTGLNIRQDFILEIYAQKVEPHTLMKQGEPFHKLILTRPDHLQDMHPVPKEMHKKTGLYQELEDGAGVTLAEAMKGLGEWLSQYPKGVLTGRNVGTFDRAFLKANGCDLSSLHYQNNDISTLLRILGRYRSEERPFVCPTFEGTQHRAKDDVENDIEVMREIADYLESVE